MNFFARALLALTLCSSPLAAQELPGEDLSLIPEIPVLKPARKGKANKPAAVKKKSSTEQSSDDLQARIRYRQIKTRALQDPRLQEQWDAAQTAPTDFEKRTTLRSYYEQLYDRMLKLDPSLRPQVQVARKALRWRFEQRGIQASEAIEEEPEVPPLERL